MRTIITLVSHALLLGLSLGSLRLLPFFPDRYTPMLELFPFGLAAVSLVLGIRFNRSQLVYGALLLSAVYLYFFWLSPSVRAAEHHLIVNSIAILFPLNVALISFYSERGIFTLMGVGRLLLIASQVLALAWAVYSAQPLWQELVLQPVFSDLQMQLPALNQAAILAILLSSMIFVASHPLQANPFRDAFFSSMILTLYALILPSGKQEQVALLISFALVFLLLALLRESYRMAFLDELTGLPGRRALNETLNKLGSKYVIAMLDVDHFKKFNDRYGHDVGDDVLRLLASRLKGVSGGGKAFRYGGEEFTVVFSGITAADAKEHLESLRKTVANKKFTLRKRDRRSKKRTAKNRKAGSRNVSVTISIGYAEKNASNRSSSAVMKAADKALYRAKKKGRNIVSK